MNQPKLVKRLLLCVLLLCSFPLHAVIAIAQRYNVTAFPVTITSTTPGNNFYLYTDASVVPASVQFSGGGTFTNYLCLPTTGISNICFWYFENIAAGKTSITCTTCGTVFAVHAWEISGSTTANSIDHPAACVDFGAVCPEPSHALAFNPGFSAEAVLYAGNCSGSVATPFVTGTGVTWTGAGPSGEPGADGITSAAGQITATADSGCNGNSGVIIGIKQSGATLGCTADVGYYDYGTELGSSGNPTVTATLLKPGDLTAIAVWGINGISVTSVSNGTDTASLALAGNSDASTGQPFIYYILSDTVSATQTITATITGTRTHSQVAYMEFIPSQSCTFSLGNVSSVGTGSGTTINTPSITGTAGSVLYNFSTSALHVTAVNSPWTCNNYSQNGETNSCFFVSTVDAQAYSLSASGSSQANNMTQINGAWQALLGEFKLTGPAGTPTRSLLLLGVGE